MKANKKREIDITKEGCKYCFYSRQLPYPAIFRKAHCSYCGEEIFPEREKERNPLNI